jgi:hypothetical protein
MRQTLSPSSKEVKLIILENFVDYYTTNDDEREAIKSTARTYVNEDHVDEVAQALTPTEKRAYVISVDAMEGEKFYHELTDEEFMDEAEKQGRVYTLLGFQGAFNDSQINTEVDVIRILPE